MRRMYSEQELTNVINQVLNQKIESGEFDDVVAESVDAYLVEHPVDITALEGQDVELASLDATGLITGGEIVEKMSGYSFAVAESAVPENLTLSIVYAGAVKNGNKLTLSVFGSVTRTGTISPAYLSGALSFNLPSAVASKIYPFTLGTLTRTCDAKNIQLLSAYDNSVTKPVVLLKYDNAFVLNIYGLGDLELNKPHVFRYEVTFLLSDSLISE